MKNVADFKAKVLEKVSKDEAEKAIKKYKINKDKDFPANL